MVESLYPFKSHFYDLDGLKLHYVDEGAGEPVVCLHGNSGWSFYYRELIQSLSVHVSTSATSRNFLLPSLEYS